MAKTNDATKKVSAEALKAIRKTAHDLTQFETEDTAKATRNELNELVGSDLAEPTAADEDRVFVAQMTMDLMESIQVEEDLFAGSAASAEEPDEVPHPAPSEAPVEQPAATESEPPLAVVEPPAVAAASSLPVPESIETPRPGSFSPGVIKAVALAAAIVILFLLLIALQPHVG